MTNEEATAKVIDLLGDESFAVYDSKRYDQKYVAGIGLYPGTTGDLTQCQFYATSHSWEFLLRMIEAAK